MATLTAHAPVHARFVPLRRGGWLLIAAPLAFIATLVVIGVAGAGYNAELVAAAAATNTSIATIPADEQARIAARYPVFFVVSGLLLLIPFAVFLAGLHGTRGALRPTAGAGLARAARWLGLGAVSAWGCFTALSFGLLAGPGRLPPLVRDIDRLFAPLVAATVAFGLAAVLCAGLAARRAGVAPRTALGGLVVAGLLLAAHLAVVVGSGFASEGLVPLAPMLPALILGIGLVRARPS